MSRGPGRWQRYIMATLAERGPFKPLLVLDVGLDVLDRSMTLSESRALLRAARLLQWRGSLHLDRLPAFDCCGRLMARLAAWSCPNCSPVITGEHIPALPCFWCKTPTTERNFKDRADCGCEDRRQLAKPLAETLPQLNDFHGDLLACVMEGTAPGVISVATG